MSSWDWEAGYDRGDPKHPGWAARQFDLADFDRKHARENQPEPEPEPPDETTERVRNIVLDGVYEAYTGSRHDESDEPWEDDPA